MKITVVKYRGEWAVKMVQGHQTFHAFAQADRSLSAYMARMFKRALASHNVELLEKVAKKG